MKIKKLLRKKTGAQVSEKRKNYWKSGKFSLQYNTQEDIIPKNIRFDLYIGTWKKASDTTVTLLFPSNANMNGTFVISKLTEHELKLRKVFDAATEKKLDSIRRTKDISYQ
jgi:hypothetical protein